MYDPKFRFALLISLIVFFGSSSHAIYTYILGERGLNVHDYFTGIISVSGAALGGFIFTWICIKFITFEKYKSTGFEATFRDDAGTGFNFPVSLSKFLPEIIAAPYIQKMHPLESELIGFLNGYRFWPYDITGKISLSLYQHSILQWQAMQKIPNTNYLHRIAALGQDLYKIHQYKENRKRYPTSQFWKKDHVFFSKHCHGHTGFSTFLLSTMPSFRKISKNEAENNRLRRALLVAIRYRDNPSSIPSNCDPLAKSIYENLHKSKQLIQKSNTSKNTNNQPDKEDFQALKEEMFSYFQGVIRKLNINPNELSEKSDGVYLGKGVVAISLTSLINEYIKILSPQLKGSFNLWDITNRPHQSWSYILKALQDNELTLNTWDENTSENGLFDIRINNLEINNAIFINIEQGKFTECYNSLENYPAWQGVIEVKQNRASVIKEIKNKAQALDKLLKA